MQEVTGNPDEMTGHQYCVPDDNPWISPSGDNFEEYNSIGHRNPHRIVVDPLNGRMWSGEIGQSTREEINVIMTGRNYQWPYREGLTDGVRAKPTNVIGIEQPPVIDFVRSEARAIIGGYVYRGTKFPSLYGKYLAADYVTDNIWAITLDETTMTATKDFLTTFTPAGLGTWGQDKAGEVYLGDVFGNDALYTLNQLGAATPEPPSTLVADRSLRRHRQLRVERLLGALRAQSAVLVGRRGQVPMDRSPQRREPRYGCRESRVLREWSVRATRSATVTMKHFDLVLDENDPSDRTRLETRFLVLGDERTMVRSYVSLAPRSERCGATHELCHRRLHDRLGRWRHAGSVPGTSRRATNVRAATVEVSSGGALGLNTRQQNGDIALSVDRAHRQSARDFGTAWACSRPPSMRPPSRLCCALPTSTT